MENIEAMLKNIDFSRFSKVQNSLKRDLLLKHSSRRQLLSDEDLDTVIAAGSPSDGNLGPTPGPYIDTDTKFKP